MVIRKHLLFFSVKIYNLTEFSDVSENLALSICIVENVYFFPYEGILFLIIQEMGQRFLYRDKATVLQSRRSGKRTSLFLISGTDKRFISFPQRYWHVWCSKRLSFSRQRLFFREERGWDVKPTITSIWYWGQQWMKLWLFSAHMRSWSVKWQFHCYYYFL
jgi:hypothetical protein